MQSQRVEASAEIRAALEDARARTEELLAPLDDNVLAQRSLPLLSELASIAYFEELWLLRNLNAQQPIAERHDELYSVLAVARGVQHGPLRPAAVRAYAADVRERALAALEGANLEGSALLRKGFVFGLVLQHELEHQETMLEILETWGGEYPLPEEESPPEPAPRGPDEVRVAEGSFVLGSVGEPWAYDNELVPHEVELRAFWIDRAPVTNDSFAEFVEDGGYRSASLWDPGGWSWLHDMNVAAPLGWSQNGGGWTRARFGLDEPLPLDEPVQHVSWYEADAFARWAGRRLPTETEWERAAGWDERLGKSRYPWGGEWVGYEANLGWIRFSPTHAGSYAGGQSPSGCLQMAGDVWEWTSSYFHPYPGFVAFPQTEYSEAFFGERHRVLRGGSWATAPLVARTSFRRWDVPESRRPFAGFRCARDDD